MSDDLIKRSDAIKALRKLGHEVVVIDKVCPLGVAAEFIDAIRAVPSADRPQGEWIDKGKNLWKCSNCEMVIYSESEQELNEFHKWCSRCGASMKGADNDTD